MQVELPDGTVRKTVAVVRAAEASEIVIAFDPKLVCAPVATVTPPQPIVVESHSRAPILAYVLGGIGVVGLAGFAGFAADGYSKKSELDETCRPSCPDAKVDDMQRSFLVGDVMLGVGIAALAGAAIVYFTSRSALAPISFRH